jgi:hypothetical protein
MKGETVKLSRFYFMRHLRFLLTKESQRWNNLILAFPLFGKDRPKIGKGRFEASRTQQCVRLFSRYHGGIRNVVFP